MSSGLYLVFTLLDPYYPNLLLRAYFMLAGLGAVQMTFSRFLTPACTKLGIRGPVTKVSKSLSHISVLL